MFYVYILKCRDGSCYTGHTDNLEKRIVEHNAKTYPCYTRLRLPIEVVYVETFQTREEAFAAERKIKRWSKAKKEALITGNWNRLHKLAKKKF
jgi:predicted GIY-YIG superfamily endonuclease